MRILEEWIEDLPQQFQGKENIEILLAAFSKQLEEIMDVFSQLDNDTDLDTAVGKNLDRVGDIEVLSRKDACYILRSAEKELTDDVYRSVLQYKAIRNNTNCTYYEIMDAMSLLWDTKDVTYQELPERPATIVMKLPTVSMDAIDPSIGRILSIKPSGVGIVYVVGFWTIADFSVIERFINPRLIMLWKQYFFSFASNGVKTLDGSWPLDGSTLLDSSVISLPVSIIYSGIKFISAFNKKKTLDGTWPLDGKRALDFASGEVILGYKNTTMERSSLGGTNIVAKVYEAGKKVHLLDGTWELDGEERLDSEYWKAPLKVVNGSFPTEKHKEKVGEAWLTTKRNLWYLDGSYSLDGSQKLNAKVYKEAI